MSDYQDRMETVYIDFENVVRDTDKAWLLDFGDGHEEWLPKNHVTVVEHDMVVQIPQWLYEKVFPGAV